MFFVNKEPIFFIEVHKGGLRGQAFFTAIECLPFTFGGTHIREQEMLVLLVFFAHSTEGQCRRNG